MGREIIEKVVCPQCKRFLGIITSDQKGPFLDSCPADVEKCKMVERLAQYEPSRPFTGCGGVGQGHRSDAELDDLSNWHEVAIRAMEDVE